MVSKKSGLVISALAVLSFIFSVAYMSSCTKPIKDFPYSCNNVICNNGGRCDSAKCVCPVGYAGPHCDTLIVQKYYGHWKVKSTVVGSDSSNIVGKDTNYMLEIAPTATPTTFFVYNFDKNPYYSEIVCVVDSDKNWEFSFDTTRAVNMLYDHYRIRKGSYGVYDKITNTINCKVFIRRLNSTVNWQNDTLAINLRKY